MQKFLNNLWILIRPILAALLGLLLISKFNVFDYVKIAPEDYEVEVCLTLYFAFFDICIRLLEELICSKLFSSAQCVFSVDKREFCQSDIPRVTLPNSEISYAKLFCKISINGNVGFFKSAKMILYFPDWVDVSISKGNNIATIYGNRSCVIELSKFINESQVKNIETTQTVAFSFLKAIEDSEGSILMDVELIRNKPCIQFCHFDSNKFEIRG